jgi:hypothetical protein
MVRRVSVMTVASERTRARRSLLSWLSTVLVALTCAAAAAAGAAWAGWQAAGPLPSDVRAMELVAPLVPGAEVRLGDRDDSLFGYSGAGSLAWLLGDNHFSSGYVDVSVGSTTLDEVRPAMKAAGWRVETDRQLGVSARQGTVAARLYQQGQSVSIQLVRSRPGPVRVLELAGWVAGLLLGWAISRRFTRDRRTAWILGTASSVLLLPATVLTTGQLFSESVLPSTITPPALWGDYAFLVVHPLALAGALLGVAALVLAYRPRTAAPTGSAETVSR